MEGVGSAVVCRRLPALSSCEGWPALLLMAPSLRVFHRPAKNSQVSRPKMKQPETFDGTADESRRKVVEEAPADGRGTPSEPNERALTLAEKLHLAGILTFDEYSAAGVMRNMHFLLEAPSEGVSSYGQSTGRADPTRKADRKAKRITGIEVLLNGEVKRGNSRDNKSDVWRYRDALFAMCGVHTEDGERVVDREACVFMLRAICDSERMPTQGEIGRARASYIKDEGGTAVKKAGAVGAYFVKECLKRLAMHLQMVKGAPIR